MNEDLKCLKGWLHENKLSLTFLKSRVIVLFISVFFKLFALFKIKFKFCTAKFSLKACVEVTAKSNPPRERNFNLPF